MYRLAAYNVHPAADTLIPTNQTAIQTTVTVSSTGTLTYGQTITLNAAVSSVSGSGSPTGTVTFYDGTVTLGTGTVSGGAATFQTSAFIAGNHTITASYGGDNNFAGSTSAPTNLSIGQAALTITAGNATEVYGGARPALTDTITGLVNGDTAASLGAGLTISTVAANSSRWVPMPSRPLARWTRITRSPTSRAL